jgi:S-adenosylmethionine/arginine decarboxylase-like enzyme
MPFIPNHLHLIVKAYCNKPPLKTDELNNWFTRLVEKVRMKVIAGPTSVYVDEPGNEGVTGTVTLATSHASLHCWEKDNPAMIQFDIYSCSCFTAEEVINHLNEFDLVSYSYIFIDRNSDDMKIIGTKSFVK